MAALAVAYVVIGFAGDDADAGRGQALDVIETGLTVIFAGEFGSRILASRDRVGYLRGHRSAVAG